MSILTALQIFGAVNSYTSSQSAASDARAAGEASAKLSELETAEQVKRYKYQFDQEQGMRVVATAKSGVSLSGTPMVVMTEAVNIADRELTFLQEQGRRTASARRKGANIQASSLESQALGQAVTNVTQIGSDNNWWSKIK